MEKNKKQERTLAYKSAVLIGVEELEKVAGGGSNDKASAFTTKQTYSNGNFDTGVDVVW